MLHRTARRRIHCLYGARGRLAGLCDGPEYRQDARRLDRSAAASTGCGRSDPTRSDRGRSRIVEGVSARSTRRLVRSHPAGRSGLLGADAELSYHADRITIRVRACRCVTDETVRRNGCRCWAAAGRQRCSRMSSRRNLRLQSWRSGIDLCARRRDGAHDIFTLTAVDPAHIAPGAAWPAVAPIRAGARLHGCNVCTTSIGSGDG